MATNWIVPVAGDVKSVLSSLVLDATKKDAAIAGADRTTLELGLVVQRVREAIRNAGRNALSKTAGSVPPGSEQHVLVLTALAIVSSTPNMEFALKDSAFGRLVKAAEAWLDGVVKGASVTAPTDPELEADGKTLVFDGVIRWGDSRGTNADYEAGTITKLSMTTD